MKIIIAGLALTLLLTTVPAGASIEIYDVDPAYRQEVFQILSRMLGESSDNAREGQVQILPTGQLLVDTKADERQAEVARVLEAIANSEPTETPVLTLRYWVLHGVPGGTTTAGVPDTLAGVVRELESIHGDLAIEIVDAATVTGTATGMRGQAAEFRSDRWRITQWATVAGDRADARVAIEHELQQLNVELSLSRGEYVVLGAGTSSQIAEDGVLALVVNWPGD